MKKKGKRRWMVRIIVGLLALYLLLGFVLVPLALKFGIPRIANQTIEGTVKVDWVWMNPLTFSVTVKGLTLEDPAGRAVAQLGRLHANVDPVGMLVSGGLRASELSLADAVFDLEIDQDGSLNLERAIALRTPAKTPPDETPEAEPAGIPEAWLDLFAVRNVTLHFTDLSRGAPFRKTIAPIGFELRNFSTGREHANAYRFTAKTEVEENILLDGDFSLQPLRAAGTLSAEGVRLAEYGPLLGEALPLELRDGRVAFAFNFAVEPESETVIARISESRIRLEQLALRYGEGNPEALDLALGQLRLEGINVEVMRPEHDGGSPTTTVAAELHLEALAVRTANPDEEAVALERLDVEGIAVRSEPLEVRAALVRLVAPHALVRRLADGELALVRSLPSAPAGVSAVGNDDGAEEPPPEPTGDASAPGSAPAPPPLPDVEIARVVIEGGQVRALDASVAPAADVRVGPIDLEIAPFSLREGVETIAHLTAGVQQEGDVEIDARAQLADPKADSTVAIRIQTVPLSAFSSYAASAIGQPIEQGALGTDVNAKVLNSVLDGGTTVRVKKLRFGDTVADFKGTQYPVGMAVTVLENPDGEIVLDIPLQGSLDNPDFKPLQIVSDVLLGTVRKAITAPLRLAVSLPGKVIPGLSILGGGDETEDSTACPFPPGSAQLEPAGKKILDTLAKGLRNRPNLVVRLAGSVNPAGELPALQQADLERRLAAAGDGSRSERVRRLYASTFAAPKALPGEPTMAPETADEAAPTEPVSGPEVASTATPEVATPAAPAPGYYLSSERTAPDPPLTGFFLRGESRRALPLRPVITGSRPPPSEASIDTAPPPEVPEAAPTAPIAPSGEVVATTVESLPDEPGLTLDVMEKRLQEQWKGGPEVLAGLAAARIEAVQQYLTAEAGVPATQIRSDPQARPARDGARVKFEIESKL